MLEAPRAEKHLAAVFLTLTLVVGSQANAGVVVVVNRTEGEVEFGVVEGEAAPRWLRVAAGDLVPVPAAERIEILFDRQSQPRRQEAAANTLRYFVRREGRLELVSMEVAAPDPMAAPPPRDLPQRWDDVVAIPVMILVDDAEPATRAIWEKRLRDRMAEASASFVHTCRVRFEVVAVGTWASDDRLTEFDQLLRDFERKVIPTPARVAIGFTSRYRKPSGRFHFGGTRGPLRAHILIREWGQHASSPERLEVLVHELGHFLGAVHSVEPTSVMRALLADHQVHARSFRIAFDPPNALIMNIVGEELHARPLRDLAECRPGAKAQLREAFSALSKLSSDQAARAFLLGLGVALDGTHALRNLPACRQIESEEQARQREAWLGTPTLQGRADLSQHFFLAVALTALLGSPAAETALLRLEFSEAQQGSRFSFYRLGVELAGSTLARSVLEGRVSLDSLAQSFTVEKYLPSCDGLPAAMAWNDFLHRYGSAVDDRFLREREGICQRIAALPPYRVHAP